MNIVCKKSALVTLIFVFYFCSGPVAASAAGVEARQKQSFATQAAIPEAAVPQDLPQVIESHNSIWATAAHHFKTISPTLFIAGNVVALTAIMACHSEEIKKMGFKKFIQELWKDPRKHKNLLGVLTLLGTTDALYLGLRCKTPCYLLTNDDAELVRYQGMKAYFTYVRPVIKEDFLITRSKVKEVIRRSLFFSLRDYFVLPIMNTLKNKSNGDYYKRVSILQDVAKKYIECAIARCPTEDLDRICQFEQTCMQEKIRAFDTFYKEYFFERINKVSYGLCIADIKQNGFDPEKIRDSGFGRAPSFQMHFEEYLENDHNWKALMTGAESMALQSIIDTIKMYLDTQKADMEAEAMKKIDEVMKKFGQ